MHSCKQWPYWFLHLNCFSSFGKKKPFTSFRGLLRPPQRSWVFCARECQAGVIQGSWSFLLSLSSDQWAQTVYSSVARKNTISSPTRTSPQSEPIRGHYYQHWGDFPFQWNWFPCGSQGHHSLARQHGGWNIGASNSHNCVQIPALPLTDPVSLNKLLHHSASHSVSCGW